MDKQPGSSLRELASLFLRLGVTAFGGPAAHIAMLHDEVVSRRGWMTEQHSSSPFWQRFSYFDLKSALYGLYWEPW